MKLQVIRDLELMPQLLGQDWSSVFLQRFEGTVTYGSACSIFNATTDTALKLVLFLDPHTGIGSVY